MKREARGKQRARRAMVTAFWDASGLVPLCCLQPQSRQARHSARVYSQVVWWGTPIETAGALLRLRRQEHLTGSGVNQSLARLLYLRQRWNEVEPTEIVRSQAERVLRLHPLRAADALQLAAALVWCGSQPGGRAFICADEALANAAEAEGFTVVRL